MSKLNVLAGILMLFSVPVSADDALSCGEARTACEEACALKADGDAGFATGCTARCEAGAKVCELGRAVEELRPEVERQLQWWQRFMDGLTDGSRAPGAPSNSAPSEPAPSRVPGTDA